MAFFIFGFLCSCNYSIFLIHCIHTHAAPSFLSPSSFPHSKFHYFLSFPSLHPLIHFFVNYSFSSFPSTSSHYSSFCLSLSVSLCSSSKFKFLPHICPQFLFQFSVFSFSFLSLLLHFSNYFLPLNLSLLSSAFY